MKPDPNPTPQRLCHHCCRWLWLVAYHGHKCVPRHEPANVRAKPETAAAAQNVEDEQLLSAAVGSRP